MKEPAMSGKSPRNHTITTSVEEGKIYLDRCLRLKEPEGDFTKLMDRTICQDLFECIPCLPEGFADLIIADPPYNLRKDYHGSVFARMKEEEYREYTRTWLEAVRPLLKKNGTIYVCCDWESSMTIGPILQEMFIVRSRITWQREKGRSSAACWKNALEDIWFATAGDEYTFNAEAVKMRRKVVAPYRENGRPKDWQETRNGNYRDTGASNFWDDITIPFWSMPENTAHPTQKSEKMYAKLILASSREGEVVFDPFLGSGTASVTARKLGRHFLGIEQNEQYCIWAEQRLERALTDTRIQGYEDGVFWERNTGADQKKNTVIPQDS